MLSRLFSRPHVHMRSLEEVTYKITKFAKDGPSKLQVISDFDHTISRASENGQLCPRIHDIFGHSKDSDLAEKFRKIVAENEPIAMDPLIPLKEKVPRVEQYWNDMHSHIVSGNFSRNEISLMVFQTPFRLRKSADLFLEHLEDENVPVTIFSSGITDIIQMVLEESLGKLPKNINIISNRMIFDVSETDGSERLAGFNNTPIHYFNQNRNALNADDKKKLAFLMNLPNIFLLGDSLGDPNMETGLTPHPTTFRIGYLNQPSEEALQKYKDVYDVVLVEDPTFDVPNAVLADIINNNPADAA